MTEYDLANLRRRVRSAAFPAAFAAALLLFFGYRTAFMGEGTALSNAGAVLLEYTLKLGGWAMAATALLLITGARSALAVDAVAAALIGAGFVAGGLLWMAGAGLQAALYVIFGALFLRSGWGSWLGYAAAGGLTAGRVRSAGDAPPGRPPLAGPGSTPGRSLAGDLMKRRPTPAATQAPADTIPQSPKADSGTAKNEPPPEGFLARFAEPNGPPDQP